MTSPTQASRAALAMAGSGTVAAGWRRRRKLDEHLGAQLLLRATRDITLTDAGRALLPQARMAVRQLELTCTRQTVSCAAQDGSSGECTPS